MQAYMKSELPFLGIQKKQRSALLGPVFRRNPISSPEVWRATVLSLFREATFREEWYAALELLAAPRYSEWLNVDSVPLCETLICESGWWDVVDEVATRRLGPILMKERVALTPVLGNWASDSDRWKRRTSILVQLKHKENTDLNLLTQTIVSNLGDTDFFLRKGIGWALREYSKTDPAWVKSFVSEWEGVMSPLSRREALRYVNRSMPVSG